MTRSLVTFASGTAVWVDGRRYRFYILDDYGSFPFIPSLTLRLCNDRSYSLRRWVTFDQTQCVLSLLRHVSEGRPGGVNR